jgi:putative aldouronate transport system permease protein
LLEPLGIAPVNWYGEAKYWPFILVFLNVLKGTGYGTVVYLAAIAGIDQEIYEAAAIDGANKRQQIFKITIPALIPMMTILTIMALGRIFNADFGLFYNATLNQGLLKDATNVIDLYVYNTLIVTNNMGISSAAGLLQAIVGFTLIMTSNFIVKKINPENAFI